MPSNLPAILPFVSASNADALPTTLDSSAPIPSALPPVTPVLPFPRRDTPQRVRWSVRAWRFRRLFARPLEFRVLFTTFVFGYLLAMGLLVYVALAI